MRSNSLRHNAPRNTDEQSSYSVVDPVSVSGSQVRTASADPDNRPRCLVEALWQGEDERAAGLVHAPVSATGFVGATRLCFAAHALELSLRRAPRQDDTSLVEELQYALEQTLIEARTFLGD